MPIDFQPVDFEPAESSAPIDFQPVDFEPAEAPKRRPLKGENYSNEGRSRPAYNEGQSRLDELGQKSLGLLETGAGMVAGLPAQIAGGLYGLGALTSGQGLDEA